MRPGQKGYESWHAQQLFDLERAGFSELHATRFIACDVPYKHNHVDYVVHVMLHEDQIQAYLNCPVGGDPVEHEVWMRKYGVDDSMTILQRDDIALLVRALVRDS